MHAVERTEGNLAVQFFSGERGSGGSVTPETPEEKSVQAQIDAVAKRIRDLRGRATATVFTVASKTPGPMRIYHRGDVKSPGKTVEPGGLKAVRDVAPSFGLAPNASDRERRIRLARWMTDRDNALFHRVIVNRVWQHHFGKGIVETPSDFGFNGGRPSHPELLDWLAAWFRDNGYSLKKLHRLVMTSATYQQASDAAKSPSRETADETDAANRLLWRQNRRRIDAETLRDSILDVTGALNREQFGPGYRDFKIEKVHPTSYYLAIDPVGHEFNRRTIYRFHVRGERSALLETFDCPDPSVTAPVRSVTTTPSQALAQWNHSFVLRMSERLASRIEKDVGDDSAEQVTRAWRLVLGREPDMDESSAAVRMVEEHGLPLLGRVLFNSNEWILIE